MLKKHTVGKERTGRRRAGNEPPARRSLKLVAYEALKNAIQELELPPGYMTSDSELARRLGMSRTPVREAVMLLENDHLVVRKPNQGVIVRDLSIDEFIHILNMREALDGMAARLASSRMHERQIDDLQRAFTILGRDAKALPAKRHAALSKRLHAAIIKATGNSYLESASERLMDAFERIRQHAWRIWGAAQDAKSISVHRYDEHLEILAALKARDAERAERAARVHVANALLDIRKILLR